MKSLYFAKNVGYIEGANDAREILSNRAKVELDNGNPEVAKALAECSQEIGKLAGLKGS